MLFVLTVHREVIRAEQRRREAARQAQRRLVESALERKEPRDHPKDEKSGRDRLAGATEYWIG